LVGGLLHPEHILEAPLVKQGEKAKFQSQTEGPHPFKVAVSPCSSVAVANSEL